MLVDLDEVIKFLDADAPRHMYDDRYEECSQYNKYALIERIRDYFENPDDWILREEKDDYVPNPDYRNRTLFKRSEILGNIEDYERKILVLKRYNEEKYLQEDRQKVIAHHNHSIKLLQEDIEKYKKLLGTG